MFRTLRSRLLLSYGFLIILILAVVTFLLLVILTVSERSRLAPQLQRLTGDFVAVARVLRDLPAGERDIEQPAVQAQIRQTVQDGGGRLLILNAERQVVYDTHNRLIGEAVNFRQVPEQWIEGIDPGPGGEPGGENPVEFVSFREQSGQRWVAQVRRLPARLAGQPLFLVNALPQPTAIATFQETFLGPLAVAAGGAFLIAILFAWLISRSVAKPLQTMSAGARAIADGRYDASIEPAGPSEVRSLAHSFNWMADQVQSTQQAQKDFVANVSHDLKTPLTSIQGWSQAILDGAAADPQKLEHAAAVIHAESARMDRMVNQLLLLANLESGRLEMPKTALSLSDIAGEVRRSLLFQAQENGVMLEIEGGSDPLPISGNRDALVQLFVNLVQNSLTHTPAGGRVVLTLDRKSDGRPALAVVDNGRGIPRDAQNRIFERFYQADRARSGSQRGTGLGLSIVQTIAEAHDAIIEVESVEGLGSRFTVVFPRKD